MSDSYALAPEKTLIGRTVASGATPATPMPLSAFAPMIPATCVPWPAASVVSVPPLTAL